MDVEKKYYIALGVPAGATVKDVGNELCMLFVSLDYLSFDKNYILDVGYEFSGDYIVMVHMTVRGIDLDDFIDYKQSFLFRMKQKFRLWSLDKSLILRAEDTDWQYNEYIEKYCGAHAFSRKGANYSGEMGDIAILRKKYAGKQLKDLPKRRLRAKAWKSNIVTTVPVIADNIQYKEIYGKEEDRPQADLD